VTIASNSDDGVIDDNTPMQQSMETDLGDAQISTPDSLARQQVRLVICEHLHKWFINEPALMRLVHYQVRTCVFLRTCTHQTYDPRLLPLLVAHVPSLHKCTDFAADMLLDGPMHRRTFAVHLLAHLAADAAVPHVVCLCTLAVRTIDTCVRACASMQSIT
jgi:hypothetical protein